MSSTSYVPDQKIETILNRLKKDIPSIRCPSGRAIIKLCSNPKCVSALRCADKQCKNCGKQIHRACASISLEQMTDILNEKMEGRRQFILKILEIQQDFIRFIRKNQQQFIDQFGLDSLPVKHSKLIRDIYNSKQFKIIKGQDIQDICFTLHAKNEQNHQLERSKIKKYADRLNKLLKDFQRSKIQFLSSSFKPLTIDSNLLQIKGSYEKGLKYIAQSLNNPKQIQLLFRASEHNFQAAQFHRYCDNIEDTITIARTQFGRTIAGFTHYKWRNTPDSQVVSDRERRTFLLQLDIYQKMIPVSDQNLIICNGKLGPAFGGEKHLDFGILDNVIAQKYKSFGDFPHSYNIEGPEKYILGEESYKMFTGSANGNVHYYDYQVFRVIYK